MLAQRLITRLLGATLGFGLLVKAIRYYNRRGEKEELPKREEAIEVVNDVLFFPDSEFPCTKINMSSLRYPSDEGCMNPSCRRLHGRPYESPSSLIEFLKHLARAKYSVDLCIYLFTQPILSNILKDLKELGVKIRIITDSTEDEAFCSQLESLGKAGIEIKSNKKGVGALMHHKFVIVDGKTLLSGSFNWTNKAVVSNYEAVIVTTDQSLVDPFKRQFEIMWYRFVDHHCNTKNGKSITNRWNSGPRD